MRTLITKWQGRIGNFQWRSYGGRFWKLAAFFLRRMALPHCGKHSHELWFPPLRSIPRVMCFSSWGVFQLALTLECSLLLLDSCADSICFRGGQRQGRLPRTECRFLIRLRIIGSCKRISWELEDLLQLKLMKNICNVCG